MKKVLITGVSSGIGRALAKELIVRGFAVWGVARRERLLKELKKDINSNHFTCSVADVSKNVEWDRIVKRMKQKKFIPHYVILNAAILENDLHPDLNLDVTQRIFDVNFWGVVKGVSALRGVVRKPQFIAISSSSAFKGSGSEGVGYAASKAALSVAFESLYQRYKKSGLQFKVVYFGPVASGMSPFKKRTPFTISEKEAVNGIITAMHSSKVSHYHPPLLFLFMKAIKLLPDSWYFSLLTRWENMRSNFRS